MVLDVGSRGRGIGLIYKNTFVGLDLSFSRTIHKRMAPVAGSVLRLPFISNSFDIIVCSDVLEHLKPDDRPAAVRQLLRVARKGLILGFPTGEGALESDRFIAGLFERRGRTLPNWLESHLQNGPVDHAQVEKVLSEAAGTRFSTIENQSVKFGKTLAWIESGKMLKGLSYMVGTLMPTLTGTLVCRLFDTTGPFARRIYTVILSNDEM
jgi:SAM-dependent methyltransferase